MPATDSTAYRETFTELAELLNVHEAVGSYDAEVLPAFGVETDPADDPETARDEARTAILAMVVTAKPQVRLELPLRGGERLYSGDARKLVFECSVEIDPSAHSVLGGQLTVQRVFFTAVGTSIHELGGTDRDMAVSLGRLSVAEINDAELAWEQGS